LICEDFGKDWELLYARTSCGIWAHAKCSRWQFPDGSSCDVCEKEKYKKKTYIRCMKTVLHFYYYLYVQTNYNFINFVS
jgi:hypothetical protein